MEIQKAGSKPQPSAGPYGASKRHMEGWRSECTGAMSEIRKGYGYLAFG